MYFCIGTKYKFSSDILCSSDCGNSPDLLTSNDWKKVLYGIILVTEYLHCKNILHNDIKANNMVIEGKAGDR